MSDANRFVVLALTPAKCEESTNDPGISHASAPLANAAPEGNVDSQVFVPMAAFGGCPGGSGKRWYSAVQASARPCTCKYEFGGTS